VLLLTGEDESTGTMTIWLDVYPTEDDERATFDFHLPDTLLADVPVQQPKNLSHLDEVKADRARAFCIRLSCAI